MRFPEHNLQAAIKKWCFICITEPHEFLGFDRSKGGERTHIFEKQRGIRRGTADTLLSRKDRRPVWCELKWGDNKIEEGDDQDKFGKAMVAMGHHWFAAWTVAQYCEGLHAEGVALSRNASFIAADYDLRLIARQMTKGGKVRRVPLNAATGVRKFRRLVDDPLPECLR